MVCPQGTQRRSGVQLMFWYHSKLAYTLCWIHWNQSEGDQHKVGSQHVDSKAMFVEGCPRSLVCHVTLQLHCIFGANCRKLQTNICKSILSSSIICLPTMQTWNCPDIHQQSSLNVFFSSITWWKSKKNGVKISHVPTQDGRVWWIFFYHLQNSIFRLFELSLVHLCSTLNSIYFSASGQ